MQKPCLIQPPCASHTCTLLQLHETLPQVLLPVMPLLKGELTVEDTKQRLAALDLVAKVGKACASAVRACVWWLGFTACKQQAAQWVACGRSEPMPPLMWQSMHSPARGSMFRPVFCCTRQLILRWPVPCRSC